MRLVSTFIVAALVSSNLGAAASAQSVLEVIAGLKFCRTLKDDAQRLKCFDGIVPAQSAGNSAAGKSKPDPVWEIKEDKSPVDDSAQVTATLQASGSSDVGLILRCKEHHTEAIFFTPMAMLGIQKSIKVLVRINEGKPIQTQWSAASTGNGAFAPSPVQFIEALPDDGKLFIRAYDYNGSTRDGLFELQKMSAVRGKIAQACNWPGTAAKGPH